MTKSKTNYSIELWLELGENKKVLVKYFPYLSHLGIEETKKFSDFPMDQGIDLLEPKKT